MILISAPDIEQIVMRRNDTIIEPMAMNLVPLELATATGTAVIRHAGFVVYPKSAFSQEKNVVISVTFIPVNGKNRTQKLTIYDLEHLQK